MSDLRAKAEVTKSFYVLVLAATCCHFRNIHTLLVMQVSPVQCEKEGLNRGINIRQQELFGAMLEVDPGVHPVPHTD